MSSLENRNYKMQGASKIILQFVFTFFFIAIWGNLVVEAQTKLLQKTKTGSSYITTEKSHGVFVLSESSKSAPLYISSNDYTGVIRALGDLQNDIAKVTGAKPDMFTDSLPEGGDAVLVGTIGKSSLIDSLIKKKKLDVNGIKGKWETFLIQVVNNPLPNVKRAVVVAGSDKRGTIYGIYDISQNIGVSPWYYWADVPVKKHSSIYVLPGRHSLGEPAVKYRGIFINDEAPALSGWAYEKFGGFNHKFYEKVFELLLRLKANYLWPAMWGSNFNDDDSLNPKLANEYGIVMGTSHHEPMMRAWKEWPKYGHGPWNYQTNDSVLRAYWSDGIKRMDDYESIITLGMRGDGDEAMSQTANIGLLEKIILDQRKIIAKVTGKDVTKIPQVWALYKEVQDYYDKGMRVPDDVTLLLCDDNWGNVRRLPALDAKPREGGYGMYYHFDYVGGPRNYKWLNTNQIERVYEQMHLAYEYDVRKIWIVNVGDIKPMEFPISFFLDYAWNPGKYSTKNLPDYYIDWAKQQFGPEHAKDIAGILALYTKYNARRKPELLSPGTYSLSHYMEAETVVADYNKLAEKAQKIYNTLPQEFKAAYYQLVLYPVLACSNLNDLYVTAGLNNLYAAQGRAATDSLAGKVKELFNKDADYSHYYNKEMENGRWDHMMDQTHIGYTNWQQPDSNNIPAIKEIKIPVEADMGVAIEGTSMWWPKDSSEAALPEFDPYNKESYYIDIFNRGETAFKYSIKTGEPWIKIIPGNTGTITKQKRLWVKVDWEKAPAGKNRIPIEITGPRDTKVVVYAVVDNHVEPKMEAVKGFVESNGYISIEAPHYTKAVGGNSVKWVCIPNLGRTLSAVTPFPVSSKAQTPGGDSPHLEYKIYFFSKGEVKIHAYFSPTLQFRKKVLRYAISIDNEKPQILEMNPNPNYADLNKDGLWNKWVADNINIETSKLNIAKPGEHTLKFWMVDPGIDLQKLVIDAGGEKQSYLGPPESYHREVKNNSYKIFGGK